MFFFPSKWLHDATEIATTWATRPSVVQDSSSSLKPEMATGFGSGNGH
jgi:hypothetical protein